MRRCLLILLLLVGACGGDDDPPLEPPPLEDPDVPTPPPEYADPELALGGLQEPLPEGEDAATPATEAPGTGAASPPPPATPPAAAATPAPTPAAGTPDTSTLGVLTIVEATAAARIVDRRPQGDGPFPDGSEVNIFTRIENPGGQRRTVRHRWYYDGSRRSNISLQVKGTTWRTWSTREVYGVGPWRVDIVDEAGTVLKSLSFEVK